MNYQNFSLNGYNMHFIQSDRFKEVSIRISFRHPLMKKNITLSNFLVCMLNYSTKEYPTQRLQLIERHKLYNASISFGSYRYGTNFLDEFNLFVLNDKYTEVGNVNKAIDFLISMIYKPNVVNNRFDEESFKIIYNRIKESIATIKEDKKRYAVIKMKQFMGPKALYSYLMDGYQEDLDKITTSNLYAYYRKWLDNTIVDIFVAGDFDIDEVKNKFALCLPKIKQQPEASLFLEHTKFRKRLIKRFELDDIKQSKLVIGFKLRDITKYERQYVIPLYNIILGSSANSKLFSVVREKYGLCYSISSTITSTSNIMFIEAGIDKDKFNKTVKLIRKQMKEMEEGNISTESLDNAKTKVIENMRAIGDSLPRLINNCQDNILLGYDSPKIIKKEILNITIDDIKKMSKKIIIDTIYLLHGGDVDENN